MDIKAKINEIDERCEKDESFRQLLQDDFGTAVASCGVASVDEFAKEVEASGLLSDEDMSHVSGGVSDDSYYGYGGSSSYFNSAYNDWRNSRNNDE